MKKLLPVSIALFLIFSTTGLANRASVEIKAHTLAAKTTNLKPALAKLAIETFYKAQKLGVRLSKPIITVIDYSLPSTKNRLWVLDINDNKVLYTSLVAHGKASGENYTTNFSNKANSFQTSLGVFLTANTYFGYDGYSLRLKGLEKGFNDKAESRAIVLHGAPYVSQEFANRAGRLGRSQGCPAVEKLLAKPIINTIKHGTLILSYGPDKNWLNNSQFIN